MTHSTPKPLPTPAPIYLIIYFPHLLAQYLLKVRRQIVLVRMRGGGGGGGGRDASFEREVAQDLWAWGGEVA